MKYKKYILIILISLGFIFVLLNKKIGDEIILEESNLETKEEIVKNEEIILEEKVDSKIKVDIKGAVKNPGVYEVEENSRVSDVINVSGGLTAEADTSVINLSKNVIDEMVIIIYTKDEIDGKLDGVITNAGESGMFEAVTGANARDKEINRVVNKYLSGETLTAEEQKILEKSTNILRTNMAKAAGINVEC